MKITTIKSKFWRGAFNQNTYVISSDDEAVVIDAGAEIADIKEKIQGKKVLGILITHLHFDHIWNLEKYLAELNTVVYIKEFNENRFVNNSLNGSILVGQNYTFNVDKKFIKYYAKKLVLGQFEFDIIETPGHSSDSVCIKLGDNLFTGDTVFADGVGRTDLEDSSENEMSGSLKCIKEIDFENAYPGHYNATKKQKIVSTINYYLN